MNDDSRSTSPHILDPPLPTEYSCRRRTQLKTRGWGISEAGVNPVRPRHCERPESRRLGVARSTQPLGIVSPGRRAVQPRSQET